MKRAELKLNKVQVSQLSRNVNGKAQNTSPGMRSCDKCDSGGMCITHGIIDTITQITHISG